MFHFFAYSPGPLPCGIIKKPEPKAPAKLQEVSLWLEKNEILTLLTSQNPAGLAQLTEEFHPADILEVVQDQKDYSLLQALPDSFIADILDEAEDEDKYEILKSFNREPSSEIAASFMAIMSSMS